MDSTEDANSNWNKSGEALVQEKLGEPTGQTSKGYNYWGKNPEIESIAKEPVLEKEKTLTLQDGNTYALSEITDELLKDIGYTPVQKTSLLSSVYSQIKTNSGKNIKDMITESEWNKLSLEEKNNIKKCN